MLTVNILINGKAIYARTVVNRLAECGKYVCDDGTLIEHDPDDGAVALAIKALQTIQEDPDEVIKKKALRLPGRMVLVPVSLVGEADIIADYGSAVGGSSPSRGARR